MKGTVLSPSTGVPMISSVVALVCRSLSDRVLPDVLPALQRAAPRSSGTPVALDARTARSPFVSSASHSRPHIKSGTLAERHIAGMILFPMSSGKTGPQIADKLLQTVEQL